MLIVYESDREIIVCEESKEYEVKRQYFIEGDRNVDDYDRTVVKDGMMSVTSRVVSWDY